MSGATSLGHGNLHHHRPLNVLGEGVKPVVLSTIVRKRETHWSVYRELRPPDAKTVDNLPPDSGTDGKRMTTTLLVSETQDFTKR